MWQTDRRTDITKLIVAFRNFANAPTPCCRKQFENYCLIIIRTLCVCSILAELHLTGYMMDYRINKLVISCRQTLLYMWLLLL